MKKITLLSFFIICTVLINAQVLVEDFNYTNGDLLTTKGWVAHSGAGTNSPAVAASTITYSGYIGSGIGGQVALAASGEDVNKALTNTLTSGTVYASLLVNVTGTSTTGDYFAHFAQTSGSSSVSIFSSRLYVKKDANDKLAFGLMKGSTSANIVYTDYSYSTGTTYLIVLKYTFVDGTANDFCNMYINPAIGQTEPESATLTTNSTDNATTDLTGIASFCFRQGSSANATTSIVDGLRISTSWAALFTTTGLNTPTVESIAYVSGKDLVIKNGSNGATVEIYSALGAKVQTSVIDNGRVELNNLQKGIYIVRLGKQTQKIVL